jgi:DNA-binding transcriptional LysR family regulator
MGLCYSPLWLFEKEIASGEVEILLPDWPKLDIGIHAVMAPHRSKSTKVRSLVDFLAAALRASP